MSYFETTCPHCGSNETKCTNWGQRLGADALGVGAGIITGLFNRSMAGPATITTRRNCCKYREYHCNNCGRNFTKDNN